MSRPRTGKPALRQGPDVMRISVGLDVESTQAINAEELGTRREIPVVFCPQMPGELCVRKQRTSRTCERDSPIPPYTQRLSARLPIE